jgi:sugar (pentulose or hexulose) kinase
VETTDRLKQLQDGNCYLGIELGSTRIKAVLNVEGGETIASGSYTWENRWENGYWTYSLDDVWTGLQGAYGDLKEQVKNTYGVTLSKIKAMGISAMMHGYLPFGEDGELLTPFRTWRNTTTAQASEELTKLLGFNMPQRWSAVHLYQAYLNKEPHVEKVRFLTTLAGYVHWKLTEEKVLGVGDASGMFPIDSNTGSYHKEMLQTFDDAVKDMPWRLEDLLPKVLAAGENAGTLSSEGAKLLDSAGDLQPGVLCCPPEGDAGTGMAATNSVREKTGNVSAGTSVFAMVVLERPLSKVYPEIDMVTTPSGKPVAMVHCNNCCSDIDAWVGLFGDFCKTAGIEMEKSKLYDILYGAALQGDKDCGSLLSYNYYSGEPVTGVEAGVPLFVRRPESKMTLGNFMRSHLYASLATLKIGMDLLFKQEKVQLERLLGHGGLFKTKEAGLTAMTAAVNVPVSVMETAGEGGAWGIALLAAFAAQGQGATLEDWLEKQIFANRAVVTMEPEAADVAGFRKYLAAYEKGLPLEEKFAGIL